MMRKLERWLEQLAEMNPKRISLRTGETRTNLSMCGQFDCELIDGRIVNPTVEALEDCLSLGGFDDQRTYARLIAYDDKSTQLKSLSIQHQHKIDEQSSLVDGVLAMAGEMRRFVSVINSTLEQRENTLQHVIDQLLQAKYQEIESNAATIALDMELQRREEAAGVDSKSRALELAESVVAQMMSAGAAGAASQMNLKDLIMSQPQIIDDLLDDEDVVNLVKKKFMG